MGERTMEILPALDESILLSVVKPERYIGKEINAVIKDSSKVDIRFAVAFPDVYEVGMSHLGIAILYDMFNKREDVWCERVYSPWTDLDALMRERKIPLFALESQEPVKNFDFLGITLQYEMCYTNVLQLLDLSGIPLHAKDRTGWEDPLVIGGGPCAYNPEPIADFFDLFSIGEGETSYDALFDLYKQYRKEDRSREEFLRAACRLPGIYVPSLYEAEYHEDGTLRSFRPKYEDVPAAVQKTIVKDFTSAPYPEAPVIPYLQAIQDRATLEIQRGCIRGCRFCQAGMIYRPLREKDVSYVKKLADQILDRTGYEEVSLSSLSSSDYTGLAELLDHLFLICPQRGVNVSLPSLRIDAFSLDIMSKVQDIKKSSLTFAPEAGSQRMRDTINKGLSEEEILGGASLAFRGGWNKVKLYFMLGLPGEEEEDVKDIAHLAERITEEYYEIPKEERNGKIALTVSTSFFVPKPFTPFQWASMNLEEEFLDKAHLLKDEIRTMLNQKSIRYKYHDADVSVLEGVFARGDRRLSKVLEAAYRNGALFDAWTDCFRAEYWDRAFAECGVDRYFYTHRERSTDELLPWDFIDIGVSKSFMKKEWEKAGKRVVTPNCREKCSGCGAASFGCGVCIREKRPEEQKPAE